ncbi:MAG: glycosyltransferase, partial [Tepidisphaeraceae bacterium]
TDVADLLRAGDLVVAPARYEPYGLAVHEALCCGVPAIVSACAGVAERFTPDLRDLLLPDATDVDDLARRIRDWRERQDHYRTCALSLSRELRQYTWDEMSRRMSEAIDGMPVGGVV